MRLNTVIKLPIELANDAAILSKSLSQKYTTLFTLDNINFFPHVTLYSPEYPDDNVNKVLEIVRNIALSLKPFE
jgi:2'-5' RNA ligase